jgi:heme-degrading monooxygenase HmoA
MPFSRHLRRTGEVSWNERDVMIARHWRGWTEAKNADAYEKLLKEEVLPALGRIEGYRGGYVLRKDESDEVEFVVVNLFDSLDSVKRFAGSDYNTPVFEPEAKRLLRRIERIATHYEVRASTV